MPAGFKIPTDWGAATNLLKSVEGGNGIEINHGIPEQMQRALAVAAYFFSGVVAINTSQLLAAPMSVVNNEWYEGWLSLTKQSFGLLTTTMTQFWAPTTMRVSGDSSVRGQLIKTEDGDLLCDFPDRLVMIANHQIYTDWLYLWWIAYTANKHGNVHIILKESLKKIPVIGWGMQINKFIFLKRNWEKDKPHLSKHMQRLNKLAEPMWLLLFPEGTNLADCTRANSRKWAAKNHLKDMRHTLLPRSKGLHFCLQELKSTVDYVYDCTIAYHGVPRGQYAQDIYTLQASYMEGRPPKAVNMYWRRFKISNIPLDNQLAFESWLLARWREKDNLIEYYYQHGKFPADTGVSLGPKGEFLRGAGHIEAEVRASKWRDFLQVFAPMGILALVLFMFYGALPKEMMNAVGKQAGDFGKQLETPEKKLLAFDGKGFKQVSVGSDNFAKAVTQGMARPRSRSGSISSVSTRGISTRSEPRKMLGFSNGGFREVSPARSIASRRTAPVNSTRRPGPKQKETEKFQGFSGGEDSETKSKTSNELVSSKASALTRKSEPKKLLGHSASGYSEIGSKPSTASATSKANVNPAASRLTDTSAAGSKKSHLADTAKPATTTHNNNKTPPKLKGTVQPPQAKKIPKLQSKPVSQPPNSNGTAATKPASTASNKTTAQKSAQPATAAPKLGTNKNATSKPAPAPAKASGKPAVAAGKFTTNDPSAPPKLAPKK